MNLSQHFTLKELCVTKSVMPNIPESKEIEALIQLCHGVLEPIRTHFGRPIIINSAFRSADVNRSVGGAHDSQHLFGEAADIEIPGIPNVDIWRWITEEFKNYDQCIAEYLRRDDPAAGWIHVSFRIDRLRQSAISCVAGHYRPGLHFVGE